MKDGLPTRYIVEWHVSDTGLVTLRHEKNMNSLEKMLARLFNAPKEIHRPLDDMNSHLWLMMDGSRGFQQIFKEMDVRFQEKIAPVAERVTKSISNFIRLGFVVVVQHPEEINWEIGPTNVSQ